MEKLKDINAPKPLKTLLGITVVVQTALHYLGAIGIVLGIIALIAKNTGRGIELLIGGAGFIVLKYLIGFIVMGILALYGKHVNKKEDKGRLN